MYREAQECGRGWSAVHKTYAEILKGMVGSYGTGSRTDALTQSRWLTALRTYYDLHSRGFVRVGCLCRMTCIGARLRLS